MNLYDLEPHTHYKWDDIGTVSLICDVYDNIKYCAEYKAWYVFDNTRWKKTDSGIIYNMIQNLLNNLMEYCEKKRGEGSENPEIDDYRKYIKSIRKNVAIRNLVQLLQTRVRIRPEKFDEDPYVLNTPSKAYDLRTGQIVDPKEKLITMVTNTSLTLARPLDRWYTFIDEIMSHDKEKARFLQRALGYSLLGNNKEECMFVAYGQKTRNGKGTLFYAIEKALGPDYFGTAAPDLICELGNRRKADFNSPQPGLSKLVGTRICVMTESDRDHRIDVATVKYYTGRDIVTTRGLYEKPFDFIPQFTMWLETNYLPAVTDDSIFMSDRIWIIPFNESFTGSDRDNDLKELFSQPDNRITVLRWLYDGCMDYMQNGLNPPQVVRNATNAYRLRQDRILMFIEDVCEPGDKVKRGDLYQAYLNWCQSPEYMFRPVGSTSFYMDLTQRGFEIHRYSDGYYVKGLSIKAM